MSNPTPDPTNEFNVIRRPGHDVILSCDTIVYSSINMTRAGSIDDEEPDKVFPLRIYKNADVAVTFSTLPEDTDFDAKLTIFKDDDLSVPMIGGGGEAFADDPSKNEIVLQPSRYWVRVSVYQRAVNQTQGRFALQVSCNEELRLVLPRCPRYVPVPTVAPILSDIIPSLDNGECVKPQAPPPRSADVDVEVPRAHVQCCAPFSQEAPTSTAAPSRMPVPVGVSSPAPTAASPFPTIVPTPNPTPIPTAMPTVPIPTISAMPTPAPTRFPTGNPQTTCRTYCSSDPEFRFSNSSITFDEAQAFCQSLGPGSRLCYRHEIRQSKCCDVRDSVSPACEDSVSSSDTLVWALDRSVEDDGLCIANPVREYRFINTAMTWSEAQATCENTYGGSLPTIESAADYLDVKRAVDSDSGVRVWLGLRDGDFTSSFRWVETEESLFRYERWADDMPRPFERERRRCVLMEGDLRSRGLWSTTGCGFEYPFVCMAYAEDQHRFRAVSVPSSTDSDEGTRAGSDRNFDFDLFVPLFFGIAAFLGLMLCCFRLMRFRKQRNEMSEPPPPPPSNPSLIHIEDPRAAAHASPRAASSARANPHSDSVTPARAPELGRQDIARDRLGGAQQRYQEIDIVPDEAPPDYNDDDGESFQDDDFAYASKEGR